MSQEVRQQIIALLPRLRRFAFGLTGSIDDADDLVQSACEKALSRIHQWQPGTRLDSWMFRIVQNVWIDSIRMRAVRGEHSSTDMDVAEQLAVSDGRHESEVQDTLSTVLKALQLLPEQQRVIVVLVSVDGMSYKEVAETLDIPIGTVMSRLARARKALYEHINTDNVFAKGLKPSRVK